MEKDISIVRAVAPEDIAVGTYVVELRRVQEFMTGCSPFGPSADEGPKLRRVVIMPPRGPVILRVEAVAVPLVLATSVSGKSLMLDVRRSRLGVVPAPFGKAVFEAMSRNKSASPDEAEETTTFPAAAD
ncbi:MAG: hypothetical protein ACIAQ0_07005 [Phycisphaerales bacterium JB058]